MNKLTIFYFLSTYIYFIHLKIIILINKIISPYLFNYKNLIIFLKLYSFLNKIIFNLFYKKMRCYNCLLGLGTSCGSLVKSMSH